VRGAGVLELNWVGVDDGGTVDVDDGNSVGVSVEVRVLDCGRVGILVRVRVGTFGTKDLPANPNHGRIFHTICEL